MVCDFACTSSHIWRFCRLRSFLAVRFSLFSVVVLFCSVSRSFCVPIQMKCTEWEMCVWYTCIALILFYFFSVSRGSDDATSYYYSVFFLLFFCTLLHFFLFYFIWLVGILLVRCFHSISFIYYFCYICICSCRLCRQCCLKLFPSCCQTQQRFLAMAGFVFFFSLKFDLDFMRCARVLQDHAVHECILKDCIACKAQTFFFVTLSFILSTVN